MISVTSESGVSGFLLSHSFGRSTIGDVNLPVLIVPDREVGAAVPAAALFAPERGEGHEVADERDRGRPYIRRGPARIEPRLPVGARRCR